MEQNKIEQHTVMPKKLAQALMDAGMKHFDVGGGVAPTRTVGQGAMGNLGIDPNSFVGQATTQWDQMQGMNTYNAQAPGITTENYMPRIGTEQGLQSQTYNNQANLANQLLAQSNGQGPNPAQQQLAQNTGQNVQTQGALMASQRGANSNPALMARQAAQQGAATQQQSAGQAATLGAQQQLAAQQNLAGVYQNQAQNALAGEQINQQGQAAQNTAINQGSLGAQTINANASGQNAQQVGNMQGQLLQGMGSMFGMADGGVVGPTLIPYQDLKSSSGSSPMGGSSDDDNSAGGSSGGPGGGKLLGGLQGLACGGFAGYLAGGKVPGKSPFPGNDKRNDTMPSLLSKGEIVLPNTVTQAGSEKDLEKKAVEFLRHLKKGKSNYGDVVSARKNKGA